MENWDMDRGGDDAENDGESIACVKQTINKNVYVNDYQGGLRKE